MIFYIQHAGYYQTHSDQAPTEATVYDEYRQELRGRIMSLMILERVPRTVMSKVFAQFGEAKNLKEVSDDDLLQLGNTIDGVAIAYRNQ